MFASPSSVLFPIIFILEISFQVKCYLHFTEEEVKTWVHGWCIVGSGVCNKNVINWVAYK